MINIDICNRALYLVGASRIESIAENSDEARSCKLHYSPVIGYLLDYYPWTWNTVTETTSFAAQNFPNKDKWEYAHSLPANCGHVLGVQDFTYTHGDCPVEFEVIDNSIYTTVSKARIKYTKAVTLRAAFPPLFAEAIVSFLAFRINRDENKLKYLEEKANRDLERAIAKDGDSSGYSWHDAIMKEKLNNEEYPRLMYGYDC